MFIKLTNANIKVTDTNEYEGVFYINIGLIEEFRLYGRWTILDLKDRRYTVKETPEEILKLIKEKVNDRI